MAYVAPLIMMASPVCDPRKFWPEVKFTDVPEVLTVPYRAAYTVKLAPLTVAISAVVGPIEFQLVPLIYEAITPAMYCGGLVASHICVEPLPSDAPTVMSAPVFALTVSVTLLLDAEAEQLGLADAAAAR